MLASEIERSNTSIRPRRADLGAEVFGASQTAWPGLLALFTEAFVLGAKWLLLPSSEPRIKAFWTGLLAFAVPVGTAWINPATDESDDMVQNALSNTIA